MYESIEFIECHQDLKTKSLAHLASNHHAYTGRFHGALCHYVSRMLKVTLLTVPCVAS